MLLPAGSTRSDETGVLQHPQVLHHAEAGHLQIRLELAERAAVSLEQAVEQVPPGRIGECLEHAIVVHGSTLYVTKRSHVKHRDSRLPTHSFGARESLAPRRTRAAAGPYEPPPRPLT